VRHRVAIQAVCRVCWAAAVAAGADIDAAVATESGQQPASRGTPAKLLIYTSYSVVALTTLNGSCCCCFFFAALTTVSRITSTTCRLVKLS